MPVGSDSSGIYQSNVPCCGHVVTAALLSWSRECRGCNAAADQCGSSVPVNGGECPEFPQVPQFSSGQSTNNCELPVPGQD